MVLIRFVCVLCDLHYLSRVMRKPAFCIWENKGADQLCGNRTADQRFCFCNIESTIPHLPKSNILSLLLLLAHLSRRLIGEFIGYSWSGVRRSQCSKIFFSKTALPIKAKFYVEPPLVGGTIFCSRHLGHMTKMAAMPIYGQNPSKIFFFRTGWPIFTKVGM